MCRTPPSVSGASLFAIMVDTTVCADDAVPQQALRQLFVKVGVDPKFRLLFGNSGFLTVEFYGCIAEHLDKFNETMALIMKDGLGEGARFAALASLAALWKKCKAQGESDATQKQRLEEHPRRIPEMGVLDIGELQRNFQSRSPRIAHGRLQRAAQNG